MDRVKIGITFRAIRVELRLRQADVAALAGVSQASVSAIERGKFGSLSIDTLDRIGQALEADLTLALRWRGPKLARLLDRRHAHLSNLVVAELVAAGWEVCPEETFNHFGDRGSVDVLAWRPESAALLIIEIKSEIVDIQDLLRALDIKARVVPGVVRRTRGWQAEHVAAVVVLPSNNAHRRAAATHAALLGAALPARTREVRRWIAHPAGWLRGLWFFPYINGQSTVEQTSAGRRVQAPRGRPSPAPPMLQDPLRAENRALEAAKSHRFGGDQP